MSAQFRRRAEVNSARSRRCDGDRSARATEPDSRQTACGETVASAYTIDRQATIRWTPPRAAQEFSVGALTLYGCRKGRYPLGVVVKFGSARMPYHSTGREPSPSRLRLIYRHASIIVTDQWEPASLHSATKGMPVNYRAEYTRANRGPSIAWPLRLGARSRCRRNSALRFGPAFGIM